MAVLAGMKLVGSGMLVVEKLPVFCAVKLIKPAPFCVGAMLTSESDTAPPGLPANKGMILGSPEVKVTLDGFPPFVLPVAAMNPPAGPLASKRPFVITAVRKLPPAPLVSEEMMIVPLKPDWVGGDPEFDELLLKAGKKVSKALALVFPASPSCVIVMGIERGLAGFDTPWVVNVVTPPETVATTWSVLACWENARMVVALADDDSASEAAQTAANRVSLERMVLLLPL
jgi:hypothetical protein